MKLQEFVTQTINEIATGMQESHKYLAQSGSRVEDSYQTNIEFDIAVLSEDQTTMNTSAGLTVASVFSVGHKNESDNKTQLTNRVKFTVMASIKTVNAVRNSK
jgi:hypothetical protein